MWSYEQSVKWKCTYQLRYLCLIEPLNAELDDLGQLLRTTRLLLLKGQVGQAEYLFTEFITLFLYHFIKVYYTLFNC